MSLIRIIHKDRVFLPMPYFVELNGRTIGMMKGKEARINNLRPGDYQLGIKIGGVLFGKELMVGGWTNVNVGEEGEMTVEFCNHERLWNILFDIDMVLWIAEFFITLPHPWHIVYKVVSDGFFIIWMVRIFLIRKRYFKLTINK